MCPRRERPRWKPPSPAKRSRNFKQLPSRCGRAYEIRYYTLSRDRRASVISMDKLSPTTRSRVMARIRKRDNRSTERRLRACLVGAGIRRWRLRDHGLAGIPDFSFPASKLDIFVDGCFWHLCPECGRPPRSNPGYWLPKLARNKKRDRVVTALLRRHGWQVLRFWEHEIAEPMLVLRRIQETLAAKSQKRRRHASR